MKIFWIFILNFFIFELANALVKEDLYSANIKVLSKEISVEQRKNITEQAFSEILQKITGKPKTLTIQNVDQYLSQYAYSNIDNQTILKISFDKDAISQSLIDNNYQFLGEYRPLTLLWPKINQPENQIQELLQQVQQAAKLKGLSIIYPMFDLADLEILQQNLSDDRLIPLIKQAAKRYAVDEVIFIKCNNQNEALQFSWQSLTTDWTIITKEPDFIAGANIFIDQLMENFIKRYASHSPSEKETILIKITNVINLEDYVKIENYLQNLTFIKNLQGTKFQAGEVEFELKVQGGITAIRNAISTNSILKEIDDHQHSAGNNVLFYTLQT